MWIKYDNNVYLVVLINLSKLNIPLQIHEDQDYATLKKIYFRY